jgi:cytochrome c oxidase subunit 4
MADTHKKSHTKEYLVVMVVLTILTVVEVAMAQMGLAAGVKRGGLIALALAKATIVALFYMHLKAETKSLKMIVGLPLLFPAIYAVVLLVESMARSAFTL